jgi:hypothetical protein
MPARGAQAQGAVHLDRRGEGAGERRDGRAPLVAVGAGRVAQCETTDARDKTGSLRGHGLGRPRAVRPAQCAGWATRGARCAAYQNHRLSAWLCPMLVGHFISQARTMVASACEEATCIVSAGHEVGRCKAQGAHPCQGACRTLPPPPCTSTEHSLAAARVCLP